MWNVDANAEGRAQLDGLAASRRDVRRGTRLSVSDLPRVVRNKAKAPQFVQAGISVILAYADLNEEKRDQQFGWMQQRVHEAPDNGSPHSYFYHAAQEGAGYPSSASPGTLALASQGPPVGN